MIPPIRIAPMTISRGIPGPTTATNSASSSEMTFSPPRTKTTRPKPSVTTREVFSLRRFPTKTPATVPITMANTLIMVPRPIITFSEPLS